MAEFFELEPGS